jgi:hypothetical protein
VLKDLLTKIKDESIRADCYTIIKIMKSVTKEEPKMWGPSIIGFGTHIIINMLAEEKAICVLQDFRHVNKILQSI